VLAEFGQVKALVDAAQEVVLGNTLFEIERVEQPVLPACLLPHHFATPGQTCDTHILPQTGSRGSFSTVSATSPHSVRFHRAEMNDRFLTATCHPRQGQVSFKNLPSSMCAE
jgi:hypothetical protein